MTHSMDIRVYYEDTDAGGVVYYTNYLKFAERARTELLRGFGVEQADLRDKEKVLFVVRHIVADYLNSARLDDLLEITTHVKTLKNASVVFVQEITRKETGDVLFTADVTVACVDTNTSKPGRLSPTIKENLEQYFRK